MVIAVKETRTEVTQDQAFELLLGKGKGGVEVELDGEGRYWLIETNKEEK
jgi:acyl-CoA synthetase (NDP forming)